MTVKELIKLLEKCGQDKKVMGYDEEWGDKFDFGRVEELMDHVEIRE